MKADELKLLFEAARASGQKVIFWAYSATHSQCVIRLEAVGASEATEVVFTECDEVRFRSEWLNADIDVTMVGPDEVGTRRVVASKCGGLWLSYLGGARVETRRLR